MDKVVDPTGLRGQYGPLFEFGCSNEIQEQAPCLVAFRDIHRLA
jgi:hypothetical protein